MYLSTVDEDSHSSRERTRVWEDTCETGIGVTLNVEVEDKNKNKIIKLKIKRIIKISLLQRDTLGPTRT